MDTQNQPAKSADIPKSDLVDSTRTIYQVSAFEIFWRNFIAGMGRAFGALLVYVFLFAALAAVISSYIMPILNPLIQTLEKSTQTLDRLAPTTDQLNSPQIQDFLRQIK